MLHHQFLIQNTESYSFSASRLLFTPGLTSTQKKLTTRSRFPRLWLCGAEVQAAPRGLYALWPSEGSHHVLYWQHLQLQIQSQAASSNHMSTHTFKLQGTLSLRHSQERMEKIKHAKILLPWKMLRSILWHWGIPEKLSTITAHFPMRNPSERTQSSSRHWIQQHPLNWDFRWSIYSQPSAAAQRTPDGSYTKRCWDREDKAEWGEGA